MATYSTECLIDWPFRDIGQVLAVATYDDEAPNESCLSLTSEEFAGDLVAMPWCDEAACGANWVVHIAPPGETQRDLDAELRTALAEHNWSVR